MYFQQILQGIASDLMDSNLFQVRSSTFHETYRWVLVIWGIFTEAFSTIYMYINVYTGIYIYICTYISVYITK